MLRIVCHLSSIQPPTLAKPPLSSPKADERAGTLHANEEAGASLQLISRRRRRRARNVISLLAHTVAELFQDFFPA